MKQSLFRTIRRKLLEEGKLLRYLTYALGEILLIVVGILLALKISDWNEDKKAQVEFDLYIAQLKSDVTKAVEVARRAAEDRRVIDNGLGVLHFLDSEKHQASGVEQFERDLAFIGRYNMPQIEIGLLGRLLGGDMELINRERELAQSALEMESSVETRVRIMNTNKDRIDQCNAVFMRYRSMTSDKVPEIAISYDLDAISESPEFIIATKTHMAAVGWIIRESEGIALILENFLAVLEEYE